MQERCSVLLRRFNSMLGLCCADVIHPHVPLHEVKVGQPG